MTDRHPRNGLSVRELAERTGVSTASITRWTSDSREVYLSRAHQRRERIRALRAEGLTYRVIASRVGCSVGTVHNALKQEQQT